MYRVNTVQLMNKNAYPDETLKQGILECQSDQSVVRDTNVPIDSMLNYW